MTVISVKRAGMATRRPARNVKAAQQKQNNRKTMKLTYYYDQNGKQLGCGDYYTSNYGAGNVYSYDSIAHMNNKELQKIGIRKTVKEFSYVPDPPAPKQEKSWLDKVVDFLCA